jgi:hypothetical protein
LNKDSKNNTGTATTDKNFLNKEKNTQTKKKTSNPSRRPKPTTHDKKYPHVIQKSQLDGIRGYIRYL